MEKPSNMKVKIHEVTRITPFSNPTCELSFPLTLFDTYWFKFLPIERLFFYQLTDLSSVLFNTVILPKLKHSLSLTLLHYLPLAGSLMWPSCASKPAIYYFPNEGVSVTVAESNSDFNCLCGNGIREAVEFLPLAPKLSTADDKTAVIAIQITLFPNEGFCIGISTHHVVLDGRSTLMFLKSWAYLCKQDDEIPSLSPELTPSFDRTVIRDPTGIDLAFINYWLSFIGSDSNPSKRSLKILPSPVDVTKLVRATFVLTSEDIKNLREKVLSMLEVKQSKELHLSTFVLACACVYTCLVKAKGGEIDRDVIFGFSADYRTRLDIPIPVNYFGNCVGTHGKTAKARDFMQETGVSFVAEKLSDVIKELEEGLTIEGFEEKLVKLLPMLKSIAQGVQGLGVFGSNRFDTYKTDFGWGKPKKVEILTVLTTGSISLVESRDGHGGVEVGLVLEKQEMDIFASLFQQELKVLV